MLENFQIPNLHFMIIQVKSFGKVNAEDYVTNIFKSMGFSFNKSNVVLKKMNIGSPKFYVLKDGEGYFVEVKTGQDGLRSQEVKWIYNNPMEKILIIYLVQKLQDVELKKIIKREIKEKKETEEKRKLSMEAMKFL